jgi:hypothetical protein
MFKETLIVGIILLALVLVVLPILYALSIGPAFLVGLDSDTHNFIYGPLDSAAAAWPPLNKLLNSYADLWR